MTNEDTKMPEPMSKEEMIDTLKGLIFGTFDRTTAKEREALDMAIKALEQTRWIPVSEMLPEEPGVYLVSMYRLGYPQREVDGFVCGRWERFGNDVIAWCRIPEPCKDESKIEQALAHADQDTLMSAT